MDYSICKIKREIELSGFNGIYYFEFGKDFSHPPEKHNFWEMVYVDSGEAIAVTDGFGLALKQGEAIFHRPMELHAHVSNQKVANSMLVLSFSTDSPAMDFFDKKKFTLDKTAKTVLSLFIKKAFEALGTIPGDYNNKNPLDFKNAPFGSVQLLECYLTEFLLLLMQSENDVGKPVKRTVDARELGKNSTTELVISYLKDSVYENITLSDICKKFYIGKSKLYKIFSEYVGESPIEYLSKLKIAEAKTLLLNDELSISKISDKLGYSSIHNFSRAFKKAVGVSPYEYKKRLNHITQKEG